MIANSTFERLQEWDLLARLGWGEARSEGPLGILAVMWVALNRSTKRKRALKDVILQPWQFSCFNTNDPNREKLLDAQSIEPVPWGWAEGIAKLVLGGHTMDPTGGASHYYSVAIAPPRWARPETGWTELTVIGRHIFGIAR